MSAKLKTLKELKKIIPALKAAGEKIVFTNGCFDILHFGHVKYLEDAKRKGSILIVAVNRDSSVKKIKGNNRPIIKELDRSRIIAGLASVDYVILFKEETPINLIKALKPDILAKGADWNKADIVGSGFVLRDGGKVVAIKLAKGRSTTALIKKIAKKY